MLNYFPKYFANRAISAYFIGLVGCFLAFFQYSMWWFFYLTGIIAVVGFFYFSNFLTKKWRNILEKQFIRNVFVTALLLRLGWVVFSYFFWISQTGTPFDWGAADAVGYNQCGIEIAEFLHNRDWTCFKLYADIMGISDAGYISYLGVLYWITGNSVFIARCLKALYGALTCILIYRLAKRNFGDSTARMAAIFCMLMPNFIVYCGYHLKEVEMQFLAMLFIEQSDLLLRQAKMSVSRVIVCTAVGLSLFTLRTVLGAVAFLSVFTALILSSKKMMKSVKRVLLVIIFAVLLVLVVSDSITKEVENIWSQSGTEMMQANLDYRATRAGGNAYVSKLNKFGFAPIIFVIPFPTMTNVNMQPNQQMLNGGNFVKNITGFLTILALFFMLSKSKWREHVLPLSYMIGYLVVVAFSSFPQSERFHFPAVPIALMFAAYAVSQLKNKHKQWFGIWLIVLFVVIIIWNWFKLAGRGLI